MVLEQAQHPYDSYVTPDFTEMTIALSTEIQKALTGQQDAATAIANMDEAARAIVARRSA